MLQSRLPDIKSRAREASIIVPAEEPSLFNLAGQVMKASGVALKI